MPYRRTCGQLISSSGRIKSVSSRRRPHTSWTGTRRQTGQFQGSSSTWRHPTPPRGDGTWVRSSRGRNLFWKEASAALTKRLAKPFRRSTSCASMSEMLDNPILVSACDDSRPLLRWLVRSLARSKRFLFCCKTTAVKFTSFGGQKSVNASSRRRT